MHENKKKCKCCGRRRKIGKFGKLSSSPDGKNPYCKDCMREYRKRYRESPNGKEVHQKCVDLWKKNNKNAISEYNKEYYKKKKDIIAYNKRAKRDTECILIFDEQEKPTKKKINKGRNLCIEINPKRKGNG